MDELNQPIRKPDEPIREVVNDCHSGLGVLMIGIPTLLLGVVALIWGASNESALLVLPAIVVEVGTIIAFTGLFIVNPNESKVLQLFGSYKGTATKPGLRWANPFYTKKAISVRIRNFESDRLKVNDRHGNPIEIAAVVVWRVSDTAEAFFNVDQYRDFVRVQSESALRNLTTNYPYDTHESNELSLRGNTAEIAEHLRNEIQDRLERAGIDVIEARISHLAYAPEIARAMLQRQQADAVIAARQKIVEGAVGMVEMALSMLSEQQLVELDNDKKAAMVSNLLVVLCSDHATQPVVNTSAEQREHRH